MKINFTDLKYELQFLLYYFLLFGKLFGKSLRFLDTKILEIKKKLMKQKNAKELLKKQKKFKIWT